MAPVHASPEFEDPNDTSCTDNDNLQQWWRALYHLGIEWVHVGLLPHLEMILLVRIYNLPDAERNRYLVVPYVYMHPNDFRTNLDMSPRRIEVALFWRMLEVPSETVPPCF